MGWRSTARAFGVPTTTRGVLRSLSSSSSSSSERAERRRQRELALQKKQLDKMQELERNRFAVDEYENYISVIQSVHKECGDAWDWPALISSPPPAEPKLEHENEVLAQNILRDYAPSTTDKIFRRAEKKKAALLANIEKAKQTDQANYEKAFEEYSVELQEWKKISELAKKISDKNLDGYTEALREISPLSEIEHLGSSVNVSINEDKFGICSLKVHGESVVPKESRSLLKSGNLSVKQLPTSRFYELYQDYVCSATLRVAREIFAALPLEMLIVNSLADLVNPATGHIEESPILSVAIPRKTLDSLNFESIDPSDSMKSFVYSMGFKRGKGFERIKPLERTAFS